MCEQLLEVSSLLPLCGPQGLNSGCQGKCRHFYLVSLSPTQLFYPSKNMQYWSYLDPEIHYFLLKMLRSQSVILSIWKSNSYGIHVRSAIANVWMGLWGETVKGLARDALELLSEPAQGKGSAQSRQTVNSPSSLWEWGSCSLYPNPTHSRGSRLLTASTKSLGSFFKNPN